MARHRSGIPVGGKAMWLQQKGVTRAKPRTEFCMFDVEPASKAQALASILGAVTRR